MGVVACVMRILKGALLGVVFLARIDRTSMIEGFYSWDPGKVDLAFFFSVEKVHIHFIFKGTKLNGFGSCLTLHSDK